MKAARVCC